jgi:hypothetical protein
LIIGVSIDSKCQVEGRYEKGEEKNKKCERKGKRGKSRVKKQNICK